MMLHDLVERVVDQYLRLADAETPGLIEGLYLEGSVALGDFRPRTSDIDFVAVTAAPLDERAFTALVRVHSRLRRRYPRPCFDGIYVTWGDLHREASDVRPSARSRKGGFHPDGGGPPSPVTWHILARHGVACRGPKPADLGIRTDERALTAWCNDNLDQYWGRLLRQASRLYSPRGLASLTAYATVWIVTGVSRLHYTLATGRITSKEGACRHALNAFPERWHRIVQESLRIRLADRAGPTLAGAIAGLGDYLPIHRSGQRRSLYGTPLARRRDVMAFADAVIADGHRLYAGR